MRQSYRPLILSYFPYERFERLEWAKANLVAFPQQAGDLLHELGGLRVPAYRNGAIPETALLSSRKEAHVISRRD